MKLQAEGADDFEDGIEVGIALVGERFLHAFARKPGVPCDLGHAPCSSDIAEGLGDECVISLGFFKAGLQIGSHFRRCIVSINWAEGFSQVLQDALRKRIGA